MKIKFLFMMGWLCCALSSNATLEKIKRNGHRLIKSKQIVFVMKLKDVTKVDPVELGWRLADAPELRFVNVKEKPINGYVKWTVQTDKPILIDETSSMLQFVGEPGDEIEMGYNDNNKMVFSGKGAEKYRLISEIETAMRSVKGPSDPKSKSYNTLSLQDYKDWLIYVDRQKEIVMPLIEDYRNKISPFAYNYIKNRAMVIFESDKIIKFEDLVARSTEFRVSKEEMSRLFDDIYNSPTTKYLLSLSANPGHATYYYWLIRNLNLKNNNFDFEQNSLKTKIVRRYSYYDLGEELLHGEVLEDYLAYLIAERVVKKTSFDAESMALLNRFYARPGYPRHKAYIQERVVKRRISRLYKKDRILPFLLNDARGKSFSDKDLNGKVSVLVFVDHTVKPGNMTLNELDRLRLKYFADPDFSLVFIHADLQSNNKMNYLPSGPNVKHLYVLEKDTLDKLKADYHVLSLPAVYVTNAYGRYLTSPIWNWKREQSAELTRVLDKELASFKDGPYVLYDDKKEIPVFSFANHELTERKLDAQKNGALTAQTDAYGKTFSFKLKKEHRVEDSEYPASDKLLALSDIEGNFDRFRALLQANKVIDENFNWIFGKGRLVFAGDMFDRGLQVTECLWLIYSLEEKAKAAGGKVHFILGNHEIMSLSGNNKYAQQKYKDNALKLGKTLMELYGENSELGRWLRTKNIMEKIGDLLFVHGGISKEMNNQDLSIAAINAKVRPFLDKEKEAKASSDQALSLMYDTKKSPFWYRDYYVDEPVKLLVGGSKGFDTLFRATPEQINFSLQKYGIKHIITGHSIVAGNITTHFDNKVINTDVPHSKGYSEALLVEGGNFYRVNAEGKRVLLFREEKLEGAGK